MFDIIIDWLLDYIFMIVILMMSILGTVAMGL